jgi:hypothetical protein
MRILEDRWNEGTFIFNVQQNRVVCKPEDFNFQANGITGFDDLNLLPLPTKARKLCLDFRFIIEYSGLRDFALGNRSIFI